MANNKILTNSELKAKFSTYKLNDLKCPTSNTAKANLPNATMTTKTSQGVTSDGTRLITDAEAKVKVTFKDSSNTYNDDVQDITYGTSATAPDWERLGYILSWNKEYSNITENTTITANWVSASIPSYTVGFKSIKCSSSTLRKVSTVQAGTTLKSNNISAPTIDDEFDSDYFSVANWVTDDQNQRDFDEDLDAEEPITNNTTYCAKLQSFGNRVYPVVKYVNTGSGVLELSTSNSNCILVTISNIINWESLDTGMLEQGSGDLCTIMFPDKYQSETKNYIYKGWADGTYYMYYNSGTNMWTGSEFSDISQRSPYIQIAVSGHELTFQFESNGATEDHFMNESGVSSFMIGANAYSCGNRLASYLILNTSQRCDLLSIFLDAFGFQVYTAGETFNVVCPETRLAFDTSFHVYSIGNAQLEYNSSDVLNYGDLHNIDQSVIRTATSPGSQISYSPLINTTPDNKKVYLTNSQGDLIYQTLYYSIPTKLHLNSEENNLHAGTYYIIEFLFNVYEYSNGSTPIAQYAYKIPTPVLATNDAPSLPGKVIFKDLGRMELQPLNSTNDPLYQKIQKPFTIVCCSVKTM